MGLRAQAIVIQIAFRSHAGRLPGAALRSRGVVSRSRLLALAVVGTAAIVITSWLLVWQAATRTQIRSADYRPTYIAATLWRTGHGTELYDVNAQAATGRVLDAAGSAYDGTPFVNPPLAAVVAAPFGLLPLDASYRVWSLLQLGFMVAALLVTARAAPWPRGLPRAARAAAVAAGLAGAGTALLFLDGQWDGFAALGLALSYACWRRDHRALGGAALAVSALLAKPHLALVLAAWMIGRRDRRMLVGAAAGAGGVLVATLALAGPAALLAAAHAPALASSTTSVRMLLGFTGLFGSSLGDQPATYWLAGAAGVASLGAGAWLGSLARRTPAALEASLGGATVLSLLASPHLLPWDLALLAPALVWGLARAAAVDGPRRWPGRRTLVLLLGWVALDLAARADVGNTAPAPPGRLVPVVLIAAAAAIVVPLALRRRGAAARRSEPSHTFA